MQKVISLMTAQGALASQLATNLNNAKGIKIWKFHINI